MAIIEAKAHIKNADFPLSHSVVIEEKKSKEKCVIYAIPRCRTSYL